MSSLLPRNQFPLGLDQGNFVSVDPIDFHNAFATFLQSLAGLLPPDPTYPTQYQDAVTGEVTPFEDTPLNRAIYAASKRFDDDAERIGFMLRLDKVIPIARQERRYTNYRDGNTGAMHVALLAAVAGMPFSLRTTKKAPRATLESYFRRALGALEPGESATMH